MAIFTWAVLCQQIITDQESNAASYINALEGIGLVRFPSQLPLLMVGTLWRRAKEDDKLEMRVRVLGPDNSLLHTENGPIANFGKEFRRYRINLGIGGVSAPAPGVYSYVIEQRKGNQWNEVASLPLEVVEAKFSEVVAK